jgi:hypothetical protein
MSGPVYKKEAATRGGRRFRSVLLPDYWMAGEEQVALPELEKRTTPSVQMMKFRVPVLVLTGVAVASQSKVEPDRPKE